MNMQQFAKGGDGPQQQESRPRTANRTDLASIAKVGPQRAYAQQQQGIARAQSNNASRRTPPQNQQLHQPGFNGRVKQDRYDTDAESINTTVQSHNPQPEYQQVNNGGPRFDEDQGDEYGSEYEDEDVDEFEGVSDQMPDLHQQVFGDMNAEERKKVQEHLRVGGVSHLMFDADNSYPTTTSGVPDDYPDEEEHAPGHISPTPQPELDNYQRHAQASQAVQRTASAQGVRRQNQNQTQGTTFQRAAELRGNDRAGNAGNQHLSGRRQLQPAFELQSSQPPSYSQSVGDHLEQQGTNPNAHSMAPRQVTQVLPQRGAGAGARAPAGFIPAQGGRHGQPAAPGRPSPSVAVTEATRKPLSPQPSEGDVQRPIEDYDRNDLFKMDYDDLKAQNFDENPRASSPVLNEDVGAKSLTERLEYVHGKCDEQSQAKFFTELKLSEWEDAGDWFLDQFQKIIKRTRDARREKRRLAAEIEDEIEQRHRHVAKKRRQVDEALGEMGAHGNSLLERQRTPSRSSRSPAIHRG